MLKKFEFKNCYSFKKKTVFSMEADTSDYDNYRFIRKSGDGKITKPLPVAAIYGANAGGKSNLIKALLDCAGNICNNSPNSEIRNFFSDYSLKNSPFALVKNEDSSFEHKLTLILKNQEYIYGYKISNQEVSSETLRCKELGSNDPPKMLLKRQSSEVKKLDIGAANESLRGPVNEIAKNRKSTLLMNTMGNIGIEPFASIYNWCSSALFFTKVSSETEREESLAGLAKWVNESPENLKRLAAFMKKFDSSIEFVEVMKTAESSNKMPENLQLRLGHKVTKGKSKNSLIIRLSNDRESAGTRRLLELFLPLFNALEYGTPLIYDELDVMLHPLVFQRIVSMFNDAEDNPKDAQLIFSAHNTVVFSSAYLRADEIHIVEKEDNGQSSVCRLCDYTDEDGNTMRKGIPYERLYLDGVLGAIPTNFYNANV